MTISWDNTIGATSYNIYWNVFPGVSKTNGIKIANVTSPFLHTGLNRNIFYFYVVTAVNSYGESDESSTVGARPNVND